MKIVFGHQIFSVQKYGGISRYFYELARNIENTSDNNIEIFSPLYINEYLLKIKPNGFKVAGPNNIGQIITRLNSLASKLLIYPRDDINIYHETYYSSKNNCPKSAANIVTVFDMVHEKFPSMFSNNDKTKQNKINAIKRADHVICISKNTQKDLIELLSIDEGKTSVVHLGNSLTLKVSSDTYPDIPEPFILFVGKRDGYKNFKNLIIAYANSKILRNNFFIICFGGGKFSKEELNFIISMKIKIKFIKYFEGDDKMLSYLYSAAAIFVYPSLYEGFGIPPLEAMFQGCPVVCSKTSSIPEVVGDAGILFNPYEPSEISDAIEQVVSSASTYNQLVDSGLKRSKEFSWKKCAEETLCIYENFI